jgi:biopolymer transport protein ExbD
MGFSKRNKVNPEFSMSSLTDIIFLLLIFFMLTSQLVKVDVKLPTSDSKTTAPQDLAVIIKKNGKVTLNGAAATIGKLDKRLAIEVRKRGNKDNATLLIVSELGVPWEKVSEVMKVAAELKIKAVIATQPRE